MRGLTIITNLTICSARRSYSHSLCLRLRSHRSSADNKHALSARWGAEELTRLESAPSTKREVALSHSDSTSAAEAYVARSDHESTPIRRRDLSICSVSQPQYHTHAHSRCLFVCLSFCLRSHRSAADNKHALSARWGAEELTR